MSVVPLLLRADWPAPDSVVAFTTCRAGGHSALPFSSFNLASHVGDSASAVQANRALLSHQFALPSAPVWLTQVHGDRVFDIDLEQGIDPEADASMTRQAGRVCAVLTADCLPVVLCDEAGEVVAAVHAGWRGLQRGVIAATVRAMRVPAPALLAWFGPAIGPACFAVGGDVVRAFAALSHDYAACFTPTPTGYLADIYHIARIQLQSMGVQRIWGGDCCTVTESTRWFSYRRDRETGRMATVIYRKTA